MGGIGSLGPLRKNLWDASGLLIMAARGYRLGCDARRTDLKVGHYI